MIKRSSKVVVICNVVYFVRKVCFMVYYYYYTVRKSRQLFVLGSKRGVWSLVIIPRFSREFSAVVSLKVFYACYVT